MMTGAMSAVGRPTPSTSAVVADHGRSVVSLPEARQWVRWFTRQHRENFEVLSRLVPGRLRDDYAAVYAYCRTADDLADSAGADEASRNRALVNLTDFRGKLHECVEGNPSDPLFVALGDTIRRRHLPVGPFHDLLDAFEQDQRVLRYQRWDELIAYSRKSANPVGRIVLALHGYGRPGEEHHHARMLACSDAICTALQLTNFWQDVRRDLLERDRVYLPVLDAGLTASDLRAWLDKPADPFVRTRYAAELRALCQRTRELFAEGAQLPQLLDTRTGWIIWLFAQGGLRTLDAIEHEGFATLWKRPTTSTAVRLRLLTTATLGLAMRATPTVKVERYR